MYTKRRNPGRYEVCESTFVARALLTTVVDDEIGDVCEYGEWYGLIKGKRYWFIIEQSDAGFVQYKCGKPEEIQAEWNDLLAFVCKDCYTRKEDKHEVCML